MMVKERIPLITIKDLTWWYPRQTKPLFKKLNFDIFPWDFTIIVGKSWVGKSTLAKFLIGEIRPSKRSVYYRMDDLATLSENDIQNYRKKIWVIFQDNRLISSLSIKDNILYPLRLNGYSETMMKTKLQNIVEKLKLEGDLNVSGENISGGEKQKVAIARALIHNPDFIIADEPTGNLDWEYTQEIGDIFIDCNRNGNTVILITHDIHLLNYIKSKAKVNIFQM